MIPLILLTLAVGGTLLFWGIRDGVRNHRKTKRDAYIRSTVGTRRSFGEEHRLWLEAEKSKRWRELDGGDSDGEC